MIDSGDSESEYEEIRVWDILKPPIESIHGRRINGKEVKFLVKMKGRSYADAVWLSNNSPQMTEISVKQKVRRFEVKVGIRKDQ